MTIMFNYSQENKNIPYGNVIMERKNYFCRNII